MVVACRKMSILSEAKACSVICGCGSRRGGQGGNGGRGLITDCHCKLQTLVELRNRSFDSITGSVSDCDLTSAANLSLTESALQSAFCKFCGQSSDFAHQTDSSKQISSTHQLLLSGDNRSNFAELDSDSNAQVNIRNSSTSTRSDCNSSELAAENAGAPLMTLDFGLKNSIEATVQVTSPVEATHCLRSSSPCCGSAKAINEGLSFESESEETLNRRFANVVPVEMEVAGQYDGDYNSAESQSRLERSYIIQLEPSVRLHRTIADPLPELIDMRQVRKNFKLVKLRQHPMQVAAESRRQEEIGVNRLDQILHQRLVLFHKKFLTQESRKNSDASANNQPAVYPDWLSFRLRMMKTLADTRWKLFVAHRRQLRSYEPKDIEKRANIRECHKYNPKYIDVWSTCVSVSVKDGSLLRDAIGAAFARLGLDKRTDFRFTVGCFLGDKRQSGPKSSQMIVPVEVFESTPVRDLYCMNAFEIFLNDNKLKLFNELPESVHGHPGWGKDFMKKPVEPELKVKKKGCCC